MAIAPRLFVALALLALLAGAGASQAAENQDGKPDVKPKKNDGCQKSLTITGRPHKLSTVAALAAVRAWAEQAKKYGADYAMWHNARGAKIKCEKFPRSDYYMCFASGKPCRALYAGVTGCLGRGDESMIHLYRHSAPPAVSDYSRVPSPSSRGKLG